jgi:hypothetical protein
MQDRTSPNSMKVLLQRTAGPYIRVKRFGSTRPRCTRNVRFYSDSVQTLEARKRRDVPIGDTSLGFETKEVAN